MEIWYYAYNGAQQGPVSQDALVQMLYTGRLPADSLIWRDGMADWIAARNVPELALAAPSANTQYPTSPTVVGYAAPTYAYNAGQIQYAGFWLRAAAYVIDFLILIVPSLIVGFGVPCCGGIMGLLMAWLYFALMESSIKMATLGKLTCGLRVIGLSGQRISFGQASGRFFGKIISGGFTLFIGFMMAGWTQRKQALHDMMASTLVIRG